MRLANIFSQTGLSFHSAIFKKQTFLILKCNLSCFSFIDYVFIVVFKNQCLTQVYTVFLFCFLLEVFIVLGFTYKYKIHFELIANCGKYKLKFILLFCIWIANESSTIFWESERRERLSFLNWIAFAFLWEKSC